MIYQICIGFTAMVACTVLANLLMKVGALAPSSERLLGIASPMTIFGIGFFGFAAIIYSWLLQYLPLNVAQAFASVQFIAVIMAASFILSEPITPVRWLGITMIAAGILIVAWTQVDV